MTLEPQSLLAALENASAAIKDASANLKDAREQAGLSQGQLARRAHVPQPYISQIESKIRQGSPSTLSSLYGAIASSQPEEVQSGHKGEDKQDKVRPSAQEDARKARRKRNN